jgi:hypothetical protein
VDQDTDSGDEATSKSDTNTSSHESKAKVRAGKTGKNSSGKSTMETASSAVDKFFAAKQTTTDTKNAVALQRLDFDRAQADVANKIALEMLQMRCESQKRKWSNDRRMAELQEEEAKRRRVIEENTAEEQRLLARVEKLNQLLSNPSTDPEMKEVFKEQVKTALAALAKL